MRSLVLAVAVAVAPAALSAQHAEVRRDGDHSARVAAALAHARGEGLPADLLERRIREWQAKGVRGEALDSLTEVHGARMAVARDAIRRGGRNRPAGEEIDAGATAMANGVDGAAISEIARAAPSGSSLAVPLAALAALSNQGLPRDSAIARVRERLADRAAGNDLDRVRGEPERRERPDSMRRDRPERPERPERPDSMRRDRPERPERPTRPERPDSIRPTRPDHPARPAATPQRPARGTSTPARPTTRPVRPPRRP